MLERVSLVTNTSFFHQKMKVHLIIFVLASLLLPKIHALKGSSTRPRHATNNRSLDDVNSSPNNAPRVFHADNRRRNAAQRRRSIKGGDGNGRHGNDSSGSSSSGGTAIAGGGVLAVSSVSTRSAGLFIAGAALFSIALIGGLAFLLGEFSQQRVRYVIAEC